MYIKTQKFLVLGASKSGFAVIKYLLSKNATVWVYEEMRSKKAVSALKKLSEIGINNLTKEESKEKLKEADVLILSPGVPINHELAVTAKQMQKRIMGELEFAYESFIPPIVAVTGTNGKTTTVTLINEILDFAKINNQLVGNVGVPMTSKLKEINEDTVCVTEVSSFQLESVNAFLPHVACVLNISPDHLERHYNMDNYIFLKKRIVKNLRESEFAVLNFDDEIVKGFFTETKGKVIWISIKERVEGAYLLNEKLYYFGEEIIDVNSLRLNGEHNLYNVLFAITVCKLLGINTSEIVSIIKDFKGVKHRIELIAEKNGVDYYNDSKATNTNSTISAINAMKKPTVLILGGSEKGESYDELFDKIKLSSVKHVILTGDSRFNMLSSAGKIGVTDITVTEDFNYAVKIASIFASDGDAVLLSPACASYDKFSGFEERGEAFINVVGEL